MSWYVYIVRCKDTSLYVGIAERVADRVKKHNLGTGAKYTRSRRPVKLVFKHRCTNHRAAAQAEYRIKQLSRQQKLRLIRGGWKYFTSQ